MSEIAGRFRKIEYRRYETVYVVLPVQQRREGFEVAKIAVFIANNEYAEHFAQSVKLGMRRSVHIMMYLLDDLFGSGACPWMRHGAVR